MDVELKGSVGRIIFHNAVSGYAVVVFDLREPIADPGTGLMKNTVIAQGNFLSLGEGIDLAITGEFIMDRKYGRQFKVKTVSQVLPVDVAGIERYLASGVVEGIGPVLAIQIVGAFGEETLNVLNNEPERLKEVHGIGEVRAEKIAASWQEQQHAQEIMGMLSCVEVSMSTAQKILKRYGASGAVEIVRKNPYQLTYDIEGIGFKKADLVARRMGLNLESKHRLEAAVVFVLREAAEKEGHVYLPRAEVEKRVLDVTELPISRRKVVADVLDDLNEDLVVEDHANGEPAFYLPRLFRAEVKAASNLARLIGGDTWRVSANLYLQEEENLNEVQAQAVGIALGNPVSVLTGGPGTGKSYTMKALIRELERARKGYVLCAPTGRAAKRLAESTGREAKTIHRTIGYVPGNGEEDEDEDTSGNQGRDIDDTDFVIVDEASMVDVNLASRLLEAIPDGAHLLLVGDVDQLPPVGAGNFLRDVIESGAVLVTALTEIYRQEVGSNIVVNAHAVNRGQMPVAVNGDYFVLKAEKGDDAAQMVISLVKDRLPGHDGLKAGDIQVLTPMHRGPAGVKLLNEALQEALNPNAHGKDEVRIRGTLYRVGDRVMQTNNDYDKGVFYGDVGWVVDIDPEMDEMVVDIDGKGIVYGYDETEHLVLAYASTVHKSQGSEYPCVVMVMLSEQYVMLQRNLLYTGITRAKRLFVMVSNEKAVRIAVGNNKVAGRYSALAERMT